MTTHTWGVVFRLAWRNLWRNHRRTLIMLSAIAVGIWAMIIMIALSRGMVDDMIRNNVQSFLGHVQIHNPSYRDDPSIVNGMPPLPHDVEQWLNSQGLKWAARIRVPAVISSERESVGVELIGVTPQQEQQLSRLPHQIIEGNFLNKADSSGIVIGAKLARRLQTQLHKRVVIMSQDPQNNIADRGFPVVGIYSASLKSLEERYALIGLHTAQQMLQVNNLISEVEVQGSDFRNLDEFYLQLKHRLPEREVLPWYQLDTYLGSMLKVMDGFVLVWIIVIFLALSFGLVNTLVMAVFERVREIGLIMALGMRGSTVMMQILAETLLLLLLGLALGNVLVAVTVYPLKEGIDLTVVAQGLEMFGATPRLIPALYFKDWCLANGLVVVLGLLAGLLPAYRASRYDPVQALQKTG